MFMSKVSGNQSLGCNQSSLDRLHRIESTCKASSCVNVEIVYIVVLVDQEPGDVGLRWFIGKAKRSEAT